MNVNFNGYGENTATFEASSSLTKTGVPVKTDGDGKVTECSASDNFCGVCIGLRSGYATVQLAGYVTMPAKSKITAGYQKLAAASDGCVAVTSTGREYLVVDSTANTVGFIL